MTTALPMVGWRFPCLLAGTAKRDVLIHQNVVANLAGFANDDAHAVIDKEAAPDCGSRMNFNSGGGARELRYNAGKREPASFIDAVGEAMH